MNTKSNSAAGEVAQPRIVVHLRCRIGLHRFKAEHWPLGTGVYPQCVGVCERCGQTRLIHATEWGGVETGRWKSLDEFLRHNAEWKPDYSVSPRRVVCAANRRRDDGRIICGARHWDKVMRTQITDADRGAQWDQGFIDQFGDWMTREEAWIVAADQNQIRRRCGGDGERLFSENIY